LDSQPVSGPRVEPGPSKTRSFSTITAVSGIHAKLDIPYGIQQMHGWATE
jgi:hypothetical protein